MTVSSPSSTASPLIGTSIVTSPSGMIASEPLLTVKSSPAVAVPPTTDQLRLEMSGAFAGARVSGNRRTAPSALPSTTEAGPSESTGGAGRPSSSVIDAVASGSVSTAPSAAVSRRPKVSGCSAGASCAIGTLTVAEV